MLARRKAALVARDTAGSPDVGANGAHVPFASFATIANAELEIEMFVVAGGEIWLK